MRQITDIRYVYYNKFGGLAKSNTGPEAYYHFKIVIGQFTRVAIAMGKVDPDSVWDAGELFRIADNRAFYMAIIRHFVVAGFDNSVKNKAQQLVTFATSAREYFDLNTMYGDDHRRNSRFDLQMKRTAAYCLRMAAVHKKMERGERSVTKEVSYKVATGKLITENDFDTFREKAVEALNGVIKTVNSEFARMDAKSRSNKLGLFSNFIDRKKTLLQKWNVNIISLLILYGNVQRNQVYSMLKAPTMTELDGYEENEGGSCINHSGRLIS